jgi:hypothetical protein
LENCLHGKKPALKETAVDLNKLTDAGAIVFRRFSGIEKAIRGQGDLDLLVDSGNLRAFRAAVQSQNGIPARICKFHDNAAPGREEWFILDSDAEGPLHLDLQTVVHVGPRFAKRLPFIMAGDVLPTSYRETTHGVLALADPSLANQLSVAKAAFSLRAHFPFGEATVPLEDMSEPETVFEVAGEPVVGRYRRSKFRIATRDLARVRAAIRNRNAALPASRTGLWATHMKNFLIYGASRVFARLGIVTVPKRRPEAGGIVVAILGPDGMGKTTQVTDLGRYIASKFETRTIYMGSSGILASLVLGLRERHSGENSKTTTKPEPGAGGLKAHVEDTARAFWGLWLAIHRRLAALRARSLARRGCIVLSDRWPQSLERGLLDGPIRRRTTHTWFLPEALFRLEERLYRRFDSEWPDLTLHLTAPYEVAESRKPGELTRKDFERRLDLLRRCRDIATNAHEVDASQSQHDVFSTLLNRIWASLET